MIIIIIIMIIMFIMIMIIIIIIIIMIIMIFPDGARVSRTRRLIFPEGARVSRTRRIIFMIYTFFYYYFHLWGRFPYSNLLRLTLSYIGTLRYNCVLNTHTPSMYKYS